MESKPILTRLTQEEIEVVDKGAKIQRQTRSQFIAKCSLDVAEKLIKQKVGGDENEQRAVEGAVESN